MSETLSKGYRDYQRDYYSDSLGKRFDTNTYSKERFMELAKYPTATNVLYHKKTVNEAQSIIQAEIEKLIEGALCSEKPYSKSVTLNFKINGPSPYT
jgi:hypothetical protein